MESFLETTIQCSTIYHGSSYSRTCIAVNQGQSVNWASNNLTLIITFLFWLCYALTPKGIWTNHLEFIFNFNIIFNVTLTEHFTSLTSQVLPCLTLVEVEAKLFSRILPKVLLKIFIMEKICYQFLPLSLYMVGCFLRYKETRIYLQALATKLFLQAARKWFFAGKFTCWVTIFL